MPATRRSTSEVRAAILRHASDEFAERGFAQATMRGIASRAQVSLSVLYRQFADKEELYSAALLAPFAAIADEVAVTVREQLVHPVDDPALLDAFVRGLHATLAPHREALIAIVALPGAPNAQLAARLRDTLTDVVIDVGERGTTEAARRGWPSPQVTRQRIWLVLVQVIGQVLMEPWLGASWGDASAPPGTPLDAVGALLQHGLYLEPSPGPT